MPLLRRNKKTFIFGCLFLALFTFYFCLTISEGFYQALINIFTAKIFVLIFVLFLLFFSVYAHLNLTFNNLTDLTRLITFFILILLHTVSKIGMYGLL